MTVKINVSADVSDIQSALKKVQDSADKINESLSNKTEFDFKQGKDDLAELAANAKKLADILEKAKKSGSDLAGVDFNSVSKVFEEAAKEAETLDKVLEYLGQSDGLSKVVKSSKELTENIKKATKEQKTLREENKKYITDQEKYDKSRKSGTAGTRAFRDIELDDLMGGGWRGLDTNENKAKTKVRNMFEFSGMEVPRQFAASSSETGSRVNSSRIAAVAGAVGGYAGGMGQGDGMMSAVGQIAGSGVGMLAGAAAGTMFGGPIGTVIGAGVGDFAGKALGSAGSSVDAKTEAVAAEGAMYTDLRHSLGSTSIDFEMLRGSVRHFSEGLGLAYNESAKLAKEFAHTANLNGKNGMEVGKEVGSAVAFGRGYGIAPEQSVQFMATMRQMGVTQDDKGNRKLALQIAESVKSGGTSAKMDEVLASIQSYTQSATRQSLTAADAGGYASFMSTLTGLSMPGMKGDPHNAADAMGAADTALRQGGGHGEASKNFSLALWQRNLPGFTGLDQDFMNEQGAFGSIKKAFDKNSPAYKFAEARGDKAKMSQYDGWAAKGEGKSVLEMQMGMLDDEFGGDTNEFRANIQSHLGVGAGQASALYQAYNSDKGIGGLEKTLSDSGVDMSKMSMDKISSLAELATGSKADLKAQASRLTALKGKDMLSKDESDTLITEDEDKLRSAVLNLSSKHDALRDSGGDQRNISATLDNLYQELATKLVPYTLAMKDGIIELVREIAPNSGYAQLQDAEKAKEEKLKKDKDKASDLENQIEEKKKLIDDPSQEDNRAKNEFAYNKLIERRNAIESVPNKEYEKVDAVVPWGNRGGGGVEDFDKNGNRKSDSPALKENKTDQGIIDLTKKQSKYDDLFNEAGQKHKVDPIILKQIAAQESSMHAGADNGQGDHGLMQTNSKYDVERGINNAFDPRESVMAGAKVFAKNLKDSGGDLRGAFRRYNGAGPKAEGYADRAMANYSAINSTEEKVAASDVKPETAEAKKKLAEEAVKGNEAIKKPVTEEKVAASDVKPETPEVDPNNPYDPNQKFPPNAMDEALDPNKKVERNSMDADLDPNRKVERNQLDEALGNSAGSDGKIPQGTSMNAQGQIVTHKVEGSFTLNDKNGASQASPVLVTSAGSPAAAGLSR